MSVIATCGHELTKREGLGHALSLLGYGRDGGREITYGAYCADCVRRYLLAGEVLETPEQEDEWLRGGIK